MSNSDDSRAMRAGFTMSLITNPVCFPGKGGKLPARVGHPQLALHFTNVARAPERLFKDRADPNASAYPQVETHLVMRVNKFSRKFLYWQENEILSMDELAKARAEKQRLEKDLWSLEAARDAHYDTIPGYTEAAIELQKTKRRVTQLEVERERKKFLNAKGMELLEVLTVRAKELEDLCAELKSSSPYPAEEAIKTLKGSLEQPKELYEQLREKYLKAFRWNGKYQRQVLDQYLRDNGIPELDASPFGHLWRREITLYALEDGDSPRTDSRGIPFVTVDNEGFQMSAPCDREFAIPWKIVFEGMNGHGNACYRPKAPDERNYFVYTVVAQKEAGRTNYWSRVGTVLVGYFDPTDNRGWAVILQRRHWAEVLNNLDLIRSTPLISNLLQLWPHPSQERVAKRLAAGASPTATQGETDDPVEGGTDESGGDPETTAETGEPAANGDATVN